jgi:hypothetical protein
MSNSYKYIILGVFGALLLGMCLCLYAARVRRRSRAKKQFQKDYGIEEKGQEKEKGNNTRPNTTFGEYGKGRWSRRLTFKTGPDKIWKRLKDYEDSMKARAANDSHIPSPPPPAITRDEASFTVPTFYHGQPQGLPRGDSYTGPSTSPAPMNGGYEQPAKLNYTMLTRKPTVKLEPRIESQMAEERDMNNMSLAEMFEVDLDGEEEDQHAISPFDDDNVYVDHVAQPEQIHALTHSLKSSSSRERINTSAYPFHPPTPAPTSAPAPAPAPAPGLLSVPEPVDPFREYIDTTTLGTAMLTASPNPPKVSPLTSTQICAPADNRRKPVPDTQLETIVPNSNLLIPDFIASSSTSSDQPKRITYRSPTESIYGCYQADDDRSASFVDFSVSPKTIA